MTSAPSLNDPRLAYFSALPTSTKPTSSEPTTTSPTLSSSSTSSSSSLSPSSSTMASSSVLSRRPQGSSESVGTTASPGSSRDEGERRESAGSSAQMGMEGLTVVDEGTGGGKIRRASTLSCGSRKAVEGEGGKGGRRKAARVGSFEARPKEQDGGLAHDDEGDEEEGGTTDDEAATDGDAGAAPEPTPSAAPSASNSRPPISIDTNPSIDPSPFSQLPTPPLPSPNPQPPTPHVDIVSYPSASLLRLLASLLEQIAQANDALNQRTASGSNTPGLQRSSSSTGHAAEETEESPFERGQFDAAPLNSPVTPRYRRGASTSSGAYGEDGMDEDDLPVTPGIDLQREVGAGGGVEGFMPSLGGAHAPMPLARRRGSSFLTKREREKEAGISSVMGKMGSGGATDALPGSVAGTSTGTSTPETEPPLSSLLTASSLALASPSATLCFHARNVPAISIEAYLLRILKYCPTTNEVFLSLLVYFDRMARVGLEAQRVGLVGSGASSGVRRTEGDGPPRLFAIDSFNVHRLVIAGVTVASKFFSDVFYTNSRYAKVRSSLSLFTVAGS